MDHFQHTLYIFDGKLSILFIGEDGLCTASSSSSASMMSAEVNMELCGARLSQREALVFGVPGSANNVQRAMLKLRMLDRNMPNLLAASSSLENNSSEVAEIEPTINGMVEDYAAIASENASKSSETHETNKKQPTKKVVEKTMIWTELEACKRQVNQVGVSACGATALVNVLQVKKTVKSLFS